MITSYNKYALYRHVREDTNMPFYIGISCWNKYESHVRPYNKVNRSRFWYNVTDKTKFYTEIMLYSDDYEFLKRKEIEFISLYGRKDLGTGSLVNLTDGGEGGLNPSEERRKQISEDRRKYSHSAETRAKISKSNKGRIITWGHNITLANMGRKMSEESKRKTKEYQLANRKIGKDNPRSISIVQLTVNGELVRVWDSMTEAMNSFEGRAHIAECCNGKLRTAKGFRWSYYSNYKQ